MRRVGSGVIVCEVVRELTHLIEQRFEMSGQATMFFGGQWCGLRGLLFSRYPPDLRPLGGGVLFERCEGALERDERGLKPADDVERFSRFGSWHFCPRVGEGQRMPMDTPST